MDTSEIDRLLSAYNAIDQEHWALYREDKRIGKMPGLNLRARWLHSDACAAHFMRMIATIRESRRWLIQEFARKRGEYPSA